VRSVPVKGEKVGKSPSHRKRKTALAYGKRVNQPSHIESVAKKSVR